MAKLPEPPSVDQLAATPPAWRTFGSGGRLWRVYFRASRHPTGWKVFRYWGPAGSRFDHHLPDASGVGCPQDRGILYAGLDVQTCLAEVFQEGRIIDRSDQAPWLAAFTPTRDLALLDLTGTWCTRIGASTAINSGRRDRARRWSQALYAAFPQADGIAYASSMNGHAVAYALYERAVDSVPSAPDTHFALNDPALDLPIDRAATRLGYAVV